MHSLLSTQVIQPSTCPSFTKGMLERSQDDDILLNILRVLERIEAKIESHEDRVRRLEDLHESEIKNEEGDEECASENNVANGLNSKELAFIGDAKNELESEDDPEEIKNRQRIPYGDWSIEKYIKGLPRDVYESWGSASTHLDQFYSLTTLSPDLRQRMGCSWDVPDDHRFPLKFSKSNFLKMQLTSGGSGIETHSRLRKRIEREMTELCNFDDTLRKHPGNDFVVVDFDQHNASRMYRIGQQAIGPELLVDAKDDRNAPWSRLMFVLTPPHNIPLTS